ncbi:AMP-binding protein [Microbacterium marinilacus]|uniref:DNA/RNA non-specific endonuclease n=1 Tax=Microbacterium marinilacus TaxID=415209 RepID=A0ABP7B976_9MICO|nr:AMP-binding protein [Microbacterium marinilacus]MBY0687370.1 AMP-binding protein [Microbacterium marinilacus]
MRRSISRIIADRAEAEPDAIVAADERGSLSAARLDAAATTLAQALREVGVGQDDLVTVSLPNGRGFVVACAAVWRVGATPQPAGLASTADERGALEAVARPAAAIGVRPAQPGTAWISPDTVEASLADPGDAASTARGALPDLAASSWKAPSTSGSTGRPKVVRAAAPALLDPTQPVAPFLPLRGVQLVAGPMTHSATFTYVFRGLFTGHRLVILPRFDERSWLTAVEEHEVTWGLIVPTMMHRILRLPPEERLPDRLRSVETLLHMGAPCAPSLKRAFLDWAGAERVVEVYAGSESNGLTMIRGDEWLAHPGSVGRPIGGTEIRIVDDDGVVVPPGTPGEIWLRRGQEPSYAYLGAPSRRTSDGWDTLGDLGWLDADGWLHLADRADDVINRGGEKIHPVEIERVLETHPAVRSAVAFGMPDAEWGQRIGAVADVPGAPVAAAELAAWARERLGPRAPAVLRIVDRPVRDDAGKTSRRRWASVLSDGAGPAPRPAPAVHSPVVAASGVSPMVSGMALGYDPDFLSIAVPLPGVGGEAARTAERLDYVHFTVVLDRERRLARLTGVNVDGGALADVPRDDDWRLDDRIPAQWQAGAEVYARNDLDRGHLVRRRDPVWGPDAQRANSDTFRYPNAAPQASGFNQSAELWVGLEDHVLEYAEAHDARISVFTAPVLGPDDLPYRGILVPLRFFKVVAWQRSGRLRATGFVLDQSPVIDRDEIEQGAVAASVPDLGPFRTFQVPVADIAALTGLDLGQLAVADVLPPAARAEPWRLLSDAGDIRL